MPSNEKPSWRFVGSRPVEWHASGAAVQATVIAEESIGCEACGGEAMLRDRLTGGGDEAARDNCDGGV